jgi:hypothetical protein
MAVIIAQMLAQQFRGRNLRQMIALSHLTLVSACNSSRGFALFRDNFEIFLHDIFA